jgi:hypothetical protein
VDGADALDLLDVDQAAESAAHLGSVSVTAIAATGRLLRGLLSQHHAQRSWQETQALFATLGTALLPQHLPVVADKLGTAAAVMKLMVNVAATTSVRQTIEDETVIIGISAPVALHMLTAWRSSYELNACLNHRQSPETI